MMGWTRAGSPRRSRSPPSRGARGDGGLGRGHRSALVLWQGQVARRTGSRIVAADRLHYLSDLLPGARRDGGAGGLVAARRRAGSTRWWRWPPACVLVLGARRIGLGAWNALMDRAADPALVAEVERIVPPHPGVAGFHDLRTRTAGNRVFIQVHLELDGAQSLRAAHAISAGVRRALLAAVPNADVIIHQDPV